MFSKSPSLKSFEIEGTTPRDSNHGISIQAMSDRMFRYSDSTLSIMGDIPHERFVKSSNTLFALSPMQSASNITDIISDHSILDRYPQTALWSASHPQESVAPGCRLEPGSVSFLSTILNTCKALLGAGIVALPMVFAEATMIPGILIFCFCITLSSLSFWLIGM